MLCTNKRCHKNLGAAIEGRLVRESEKTITFEKVCPDCGTAAQRSYQNNPVKELLTKSIKSAINRLLNRLLTGLLTRAINSPLKG